MEGKVKEEGNVGEGCILMEFIKLALLFLLHVFIEMTINNASTRRMQNYCHHRYISFFNYFLSFFRTRFISDNAGVILIPHPTPMAMHFYLSGNTYTHADETLIINLTVNDNFFVQRI